MGKSCTVGELAVLGRQYVNTDSCSSNGEMVIEMLKEDVTREKQLVIKWWKDTNDGEEAEQKRKGIDLSKVSENKINQLTHLYHISKNLHKTITKPRNEKN